MGFLNALKFHLLYFQVSLLYGTTWFYASYSYNLGYGSFGLQTTVCSHKYCSVPSCKLHIVACHDQKDESTFNSSSYFATTTVNITKISVQTRNTSLSQDTSLIVEWFRCSQRSLGSSVLSVSAASPVNSCSASTRRNMTPCPAERNASSQYPTQYIDFTCCIL